MSIYRFSTGTHLTYNSVDYVVLKYSPENGQTVTLEEVNGNAIIVKPRDELVNAFFSGNMNFRQKTRNNVNKETNPIPNPEELRIDISDYPNHLVEIARFRLKVIFSLIIEENPRTHDMVIERSKEMQSEADKVGQKVSVRSIYRWISNYEAGGREIRCLIPNVNRRGGAGKSRLPKDVLDLVDDVIKENISREKSSMHGMLSIVASQIEDKNIFKPAYEKLSVPSLSTINRRIEVLDVKQFLVAKYGQKNARKMGKQVYKTNYPDLPMERVEFDHTKTDLFVVDEKDGLPLGRCTLSFALDMATRYPIGYYLGFEPPSYYSVMECLYHGICKKPNVKELYGTKHDWIAYGIPNTLVVDQGKEFIGKDLSDACESLGIVLDVAPVKTPEFKGGVERNFRTINSGLFHQLPGTTFSNFLEKGDYNSEKLARVTINDLEKMLNHYIIETYCENKHRGLGGIPARRWEYALQTNFFPRMPTDIESLRILLGRVDYRVIHRYGIEFESIRYNCQDLAYLRLKSDGKKIKIKYHPGDLSRIYAYNEFEKKYVEVPALDQEYASNLSLWKHKVIKRYAMNYGDREDLAALGRAKRKIQELVEQSMSLHKKTTKRAKMQRFMSGGRPNSIYSNENSSAKSVMQETPTIKPKELPLKNYELPQLDADMDGWEIVEGFTSKQEHFNKEI